MKLSNVVERTIDVVCLIASFAILYLLPDRINVLFYLLFAVSAFLFCIGFFRLIATFDEPDSPEESGTAWLSALCFFDGVICTVFFDDGINEAQVLWYFM